MSDNLAGESMSPERIRSIRQQLGLTQEQFAYKVGVTFTTVNRWENGKSNPSRPAGMRINDILREASRSRDQ